MVTAPALVFVGVCALCGTPTEPCPAEAPGASWKSAEQWLFLTLQEHRLVCLGRPAAGGQPSLFGPESHQ